MKILIAPMAGTAPMNGPFSRAEKLAVECSMRGHEVCFCASEDINYHPVGAIPNYPSPIPSPMGLPGFLGRRMFRFARLTGLQKRKPVRSYEEVLRITGALNADHFADDVQHIRRAIRDFGADIVYAEFRIEAIIAAKLESRPVLTGYSYPVRAEYACSPQYSTAVRELLQQYGFAGTDSILEIFHWTEKKIVPSIYELEPIDDEYVVYTGPFNLPPSREEAAARKNKIIVSMDNSGISVKRQITEMKKFLPDTGFEILIASKKARAGIFGNVTVSDHFDFRKEMPRAVLFINHGGQNSIMDGLLYGVPQLVFPGKVFERQYNAESVDSNEAGFMLRDCDFRKEKIEQVLNIVMRDSSYAEKAAALGDKIRIPGGVKRAVDEIETCLKVRVRS